MDILTRIVIAETTLEIIQRGHYEKNGKHIDLTDAINRAKAGSKHYKAEEFGPVFEQAELLLATRRDISTTFEITGETTLQAARRLAGPGRKVMCLNFASAKNPGGGFLTGAQSQEESIARSSGLYPCISQMMDLYETNRRLKTCLYTDDMIFSPAVPVFRLDEGELLEDFYCVDIITSAAVNAGIVRNREQQNIDKIEPVMLERMDKMLAVALVNQCDTLVLGAWGCGVFQNNPEDVAQWFAGYLNPNGKYAGAFKQITFAIYSSGKNQAKTIFENAFGVQG